MENNQTNNLQPTKKKKRINKKEQHILREVALICLFLVICAGLIYGSIYLVDQKISDMEARIQEGFQEQLDAELVLFRTDTEASLKELEDRVDSLRREIENVADILDNADETLGNSNDTSRELSRKIEDLDEQLKALEESLKILSQRP